MEQNIIRKDGTRGSKGKTVRVGLLILCVVIAATFSYCTKFPTEMYKGLIYGDYMDSSLNSDGTVWILTDGTIRFNNSYNDQVVEEHILCRTNLYLYDPANSKVLKCISTDFSDVPPRFNLFQKDGKLWQIGKSTITIMNAQNGEVIESTGQFCLRRTAFNPGIARTVYNDMLKCVDIETKDGRKYLYSLTDDGIISYVDKEIWKVREQRLFSDKKDGFFALAYETSDNYTRQLLHYADANAVKTGNINISGFSFEDLTISQTDAEKESAVKPLVSAGVFLDPLLIYQDKDQAIILSQKQTGEESDRLLTCVDSSGKIKWTTGQEALFGDLKITKDNQMPKPYIKSILKCEKSGNIFVLTFQNHGIAGYDFTTGKRIWLIQ